MTMTPTHPPTPFTPSLTDQHLHDLVTEWAARPMVEVGVPTIGEYILRHRFDADRVGGHGWGAIAPDDALSAASTVAFALGLLHHAADDTHDGLDEDAFEQRVIALECGLDHDELENVEWAFRPENQELGVRAELDPPDLGVVDLGTIAISANLEVELAADPARAVTALIRELVRVLAWSRDRLEFISLELTR